MSDELYTTSRLKAHARCERYHRYRYDLGIQPDEMGAAASFGTAGHAALEVWYRALADGDPEAALVDAIATVDTSQLDAYDRAKLRVLVRGYNARWLLEFVDGDGVYLFDVLGVESQFRYDLGGFEIGGKLDALVRRRSDGAMFVVEHKFTGSNVGDGESYWERLAIDTQVSIYLDGASVLTGEDVAGVIYDVIARPSHKPHKATPLERQTFTKGKGCKPCGGKAGEAGSGKMRTPGAALTFTDAPCSICKGSGWSPDDGAPRLHADQRATDETPEEFEARITEAVAEAPDDTYKRAVIVRLDDELPTMRRDLLDRIELIEFGRKRNIAPRNPDQCFAYGSVCPFFGACSGRADIEDPIRFPRRGAHPELAAEQT